MQEHVSADGCAIISTNWQQILHNPNSRYLAQTFNYQRIFKIRTSSTIFVWQNLKLRNPGYVRFKLAYCTEDFFKILLQLFDLI